jgi:hypothetical protein
MANKESKKIKTHNEGIRAMRMDHEIHCEELKKYLKELKKKAKK